MFPPPKVGLAAIAEGARVLESSCQVVPFTYMKRSHPCPCLQPIEVALLPHVCFDLENFEDAERRVSPDVCIWSVSTTRGHGRDAVYEWLRARRKQLDHWQRRRNE
jgi:hypothetical protein